MRRPSLLASLTAMLVVLALPAVAVAQTPDEQAEILANQQWVPSIAPTLHAPQLTCFGGAAPITLYSSDLEADNGGWTESGYGEWEHGTIVPGVHDGCDAAPTGEPTGAHSGVNVWATNLDGCYANSGADSLLSYTFDLSAVNPGYPASFELWHWYLVFETFDWIKVKVNGTEVWRSADTAVHDWAHLAVDLTPWSGQAAVTVTLELHATTVVNRMGWYVDNLEVLYCDVIPVELMEFSAGEEDVQ